MEYELTVKARLVLLSILPAEGKLTAIRIARELREGLSFDEREQKDLQMVESEGGRVKWEDGAVPDKKLDIGPTGVQMIRDALERLDQDEKLRDEHIEVCELFEYGDDR